MLRPPQSPGGETTSTGPPPTAAGTRRPAAALTLLLYPGTRAEAGTCPRAQCWSVGSQDVTPSSGSGPLSPRDLPPELAPARGGRLALLGHVTPHVELDSDVLTVTACAGQGRATPRGPGGRGHPHSPQSGRTWPGWRSQWCPPSSPRTEDDEGRFPHLRGESREAPALPGSPPKGRVPRGVASPGPGTSRCS